MKKRKEGANKTRGEHYSNNTH